MIVDRVKAAVYALSIAILIVTTENAFSNEFPWTEDDYYQSYREHGFGWENNQLGISDEVPFPWKPVGYDELEGLITAARSEFKLSKSGMFKSIYHDGIEFIENVQLIGNTSNGKLDFSKGEIKTIVLDQKIVFESNLDNSALQATLIVEYHYDGFSRITIVIDPVAPLVLEELYLRMSIHNMDKAVYSKYIEYDYVKQKFDRGSVSTSSKFIEDKINDKFSPVFSLENDKVGLEFISETNKNYSVKRNNDVISVVKSKDKYDVIYTMVNKSLPIHKKTSYQTAVFLFGAREKSDEVYMISSKNASEHKKGYASLCCLDIVYFGNKNRLPYDILGLPRLSESEVSAMIEELSTLESIAKGYAPYSTLHIFSTEVKELEFYGKNWNSNKARVGSWGDKYSRKPSMQPVSLESKSIGDFIIHTHVEEIRKRGLKAVYHDVTGMTTLPYTMAKMLTEGEIREGKVYFPFYGFREFAKRYWAAVKNVNSDISIIWHTGAILPKSISTFTDSVVFGESFHFLFSSTTVNKEFPHYNPDYFSVNPALFYGPLSQKNGFSYKLLPQIVRKNVPEFNKAIFRRKSRQALAFALLNRYPVWGTRLMKAEYKKYIKMIDRFDGFDDAGFKRLQLNMPDHGGNLDIAIYEKGLAGLYVIVNRSDVPVPRKHVKAMLARAVDNKHELTIVNSDGSMLQPFDYVVFGSGEWTNR